MAPESEKSSLLRQELDRMLDNPTRHSLNDNDARRLKNGELSKEELRAAIDGFRQQLSELKINTQGEKIDEIKNLIQVYELALYFKE